MALRARQTRQRLLAALALASIAAMSGCGGGSGPAVPSVSRPAAGAGSEGQVIGYSVAQGGLALTLYLQVSQVTTLQRVEVLAEDSAAVRVRATVLVHEGNAVAMPGYVFDTVRLSSPLGGRQVVDERGEVLGPIPLEDVRPRSGETRRASWSPG